MILGIMQPYFFPYIGYWQLLNAVDEYIIYDDVNYIKKGFINRNNVLLNEKPHMITLEIIAASQNKKINELRIGDNSKKLLKTIEQSYKKAPFFKDAIVLIEDIFTYNEENLALFIGNSIFKIANYLQIDTVIKYSSQVNKNNKLVSQGKILDICKSIGATTYINAIGGQDIYDKNIFELHQIEIKFLKTKSIPYKQFSENFIPNLSIIDVIMFQSKDQIQIHLQSFELV